MLVGNQKIKEQLSDIVTRGEYAHAYLFVGPKGVGKTAFAIDFAKSLICETGKKCSSCSNCLLFDSGNHPDVLIFDSEETLSVETVRDSIDTLSKKPFQAKKKIMILANADRMSTSAANSLLKTLEEPTAETILILTTDNKDKLLPTIISRAQIIKFSDISNLEFSNFLSEMNLEVNDDLLNFSQNRVGLVKRWQEDKEFVKKITELVSEISESLNNENIWEKIKLAEKITKNKEDIPFLIDAVEYFYAKELIKTETEKLKIASILDKLARVRDLLTKNVNQKLVFEALLLGEL